MSELIESADGLYEAIMSSTDEIELVEVLEHKSKNTYIVKTQDGVVCTAWYNDFKHNRYFYVDDVFGVIEDYEEN